MFLENLSTNYCLNYGTYVPTLPLAKIMIGTLTRVALCSSLYVKNIVFYEGFSR